MKKMLIVLLVVLVLFTAVMPVCAKTDEPSSEGNGTPRPGQPGSGGGWGAGHAGWEPPPPGQE